MPVRRRDGSFRGDNGMRNHRFAVALLAGVVALLACPLAAGAAEAPKKAKDIADILPAKTHFYASFRMPRAEEFQGSALHKIAQDEEMKAFLANAREEYGKLKEQFRAQIPVSPELLEELFHDEFTFAFTGLRTNDKKVQEPGLVFSAVFDRPPQEAEKAVVEALRKIAQGMVADPQPAFQHKNLSVKYLAVPTGVVCYTFIGQRLVLTTGELAMRDVLKCADPLDGAGEAQSLARDPDFKKVMQRVGGPGGILTAYFNSKLFFAQFGNFMPPRQVGFFEAVGVYNAKAMGLCSRFADGGIRDSFYVLAPGERTGIMPAAGNPVDLSLLKQVPPDATLVTLGRLSLKDLYSVLMRAVANTDPDQFQRITGEITEFEQKAGFKIGSDLFGSMGTQWMTYQSPHESVLMVELKDAQKFQSCLGGLVEMAEGKAVWQQMDYKGAQINYLTVKEKPFPASPSYAIVDKYAVFGLYPQTLKSYLSRRGKEGPSIVDKEDFKRVAGRFMKGCDSITYMDIGENLSDCYNLLVMASPMVYGAKGVSLRPELLPHPDVLRPHLFGLGSGRINDQEGILWESFSPVGSMGGVLGIVGGVSKGVTSSSGAVSMPLVAAVVLPALAKARNQARGVACMSNVKQIGLGCAMSMADHEDQLPAKLEDLVQAHYLEGGQVFVCPQDKNPMTVGGIKTSYYYVGRLPGPPPAELVLVYEKGGIHGNGRTVLFGDGHVEVVREDALKARLRQSLAALKAKDWDKVPHERRIEIEAFYAGK